MNSYQIPNFPEYKSMYVDHKLDKIAEIERSRYDMASAENDQLTRTMGSIRLLNGDKQVIKDAEDRVRTMIGTSDKFQLLGKNVNAAVTDFATDHRILNAMDSKAVADKEDEYANQLRAKGIEVPFQMAPKVDLTTGQVVRDQNRNVVMVKASDVHNTETQGIYGTKVQERLDYDQKILQLLSGIAEDGYSTIREGLLAKGLTTDDVGKWVRTGGSGVSQKKKDDIADLLVDEFLLSPEGNQLYNIKTKLEINSKDMLKSDKEARAEIQKHIRDLGQKQVGWKENAQQQIADIPEVVLEPNYGDPLVVENLNKDDSEVLRTSNLSAGEKADLYNSDGSLKTTSSWDTTSKVVEFLAGKGRIENAKKMEKTMAANNLKALREDIAKSGGIGKINYNKHGTKTILSFIHTDKEFRKTFPQKPGQTDEAYGAEVLTALKSYTKTYIRVVKNIPAAASFVLQGLDNAAIVSEDEQVFAGIEEFANNANSFWTGNSGVISEIKKKLSDLSQGTGDGSTSIHLVTDGKHSHIGKYRVNTTDYGTFYIEPAANMSKGLDLSKAISEIKSRKEVGHTLLVQDAKPLLGETYAGHKLYATTEIVDSTVKNQRGYITKISVVDPNNKIIGELSAGEVNKMEADMYEASFRGRNDVLGTSVRHQTLLREVTPLVHKMKE